MAKRFTDTDLWDKEWFMALSPKLKCLVKAVRDKCDIAGIWSPNWRIMSMYVGEPVTEEDILSIDKGNQFVKIGAKIFCKGFIQFQYGETLSEKSPVHSKILKILSAHKIDYKYPIYSLQEEEEEEEMEMEEEKEKDEEEEKSDPIFSNQVQFIVNDLNRKCNTEYRASSKKTQELIRARIRDGFTLTDFEYVHTVKAMEWMGTDQEKYLRPETLYGTKFESYKNQKPNVAGNSKFKSTEKFNREDVLASHAKHFGSKQPGVNANSSG